MLISANTKHCQPEDQAIADYLLRIFRTSVPYLPKTAKTFGQELQVALQPMILKPSGTSGVSVSSRDIAYHATIANLSIGVTRDRRLPVRSCTTSYPGVQAIGISLAIMYL